MTDFLTTSAGLTFTCANCDASNFLPNPHAGETAPDARHAEPAPAAAGAERAGDDQDTLCPKCGHRQRDAYACHRCGLVFEKYDPASLPPDPLQAGQLWEEIRKRPGDDQLHEAFLNECLAVNRLDYATRMYRTASHDPGFRPIGERWLKRVAEMGHAQIDAGTLSPELRQESNRTIKIVMWSIVVAGFGFLAYSILRMTNMLGGP
jgi:hypothetical protein